MNKFILIPYDQYASFKSYLMKKDHVLSSDKKENEIDDDADDDDDDDAAERGNEKDSSRDITDKNNKEILDNVNDSQSPDNLLPPPGIPVKKEKTEKIFHYENRDGQDGVTYIGHYISTLYITYIRHYISALFNLSFMFIHCHKR